MTQNEQKLIDEIMDWFSFKNVARVMQTLEWRWANCNDYKSIPVESTLREAARYRLREAIQDSLGSKDYQTGCGGFNYRVYRKNNVVTYVALTFVVEGWSSEA
jgi:Mlc titration factor MtfA (ptsG expression regulator)